ncbi:MAG TPA: 4-alpha-glucanotransferase [Acidimicrobiales bacterium]|nr:4-alpha-glucanotransferase [Acidimicrobiales bacterium]
MTRDPKAWGIDPGYHDVTGRWHDADHDAVEAVLDVMGAGSAPPPGTSGDDRAWVVTGGESAWVPGGGEVTLEDGTVVGVGDRLPEDLPIGYHVLERSEGARVTLIVAPGRCHLPEDLCTWGPAIQLPAARSRHSWGMGDIADLELTARWAAERGAGMALLNPLHASLPGVPQQASPYFASSRCFRNPLYIDVEAVPGAAGTEEVERAAAAGRALNAEPHVDRDAIHALKMDALQAIWDTHHGRPPGVEDFDRFLADGGAALSGYATFCALSEVHGRGWGQWPEGFRRPDGPAVAAFAREHNDRVRFHSWLQWLVDRQLAEASRVLGLVQDLAIGADPAGADAWLWQDTLALGVRVGAPPDEFNTQGQDWGFPPFDPWRLREAAFGPFVSVVRSVLAHAAGMRVDHVAGLFRLYWIPPGFGSADGVYVRYPWREMLAIVALESHRAGAWVVGEDLGTVEDEVRDELGHRRVLSTKLFWFEPTAPEHYPRQSFAAVTTHDLPTVAGAWTGSDLAEQQELGVDPNVEAAEGLRRRMRDWTGLPEDATAAQAVARVYDALGHSEAAVVVATMEDLMTVERRPNLPGTTDDQRDNWSVALPRPVEELEGDPVAESVARSLRRDRAGEDPSGGHPVDGFLA